MSILVADDFDQNFLVAVSAALKGCVSGINLSATSFILCLVLMIPDIVIVTRFLELPILLQLDTDQVHGVAEKNSVSELQLPHSLVQMTSNDVKPSLSAKWQLAHCLHRIDGCQESSPMIFKLQRWLLLGNRLNLLAGHTRKIASMALVVKC